MTPSLSYTLALGMPGIVEWLLILFFMAAPVLLLIALITYLRKRKNP